MRVGRNFNINWPTCPEIVFLPSSCGWRSLMCGLIVANGCLVGGLMRNDSLVIFRDFGRDLCIEKLASCWQHITVPVGALETWQLRTSLMGTIGKWEASMKLCEDSILSRYLGCCVIWVVQSDGPAPSIFTPAWQQNSDATVRIEGDGPGMLLVAMRTRHCRGRHRGKILATCHGYCDSGNRAKGKERRKNQS